MFVDLSEIISLLNVIVEINTMNLTFSFFFLVVSLFTLFRIRKDRTL